ncbi:hypothetical protein [Pseudonocardia xishanensis]|uniref:DUF4352 domain-containing protein n=1 Tax=Pseudonocardia xishanensis TaxID=630995 RepID=A0ABP8RL91_9PSEU
MSQQSPFQPYGGQNPYGQQQPGPYQQQPQPQQYGQQWAPQQQAHQEFGFAPQQRQPHPTNVPAQLPKPKRRKWPWIVGALVLVPVLFMGGCMALLGGAATAIDNARTGGTTAVGQTLTYASGLGISASVPAPWKADNEFEVGRNEQGYESTVTVTNGTKDPVGAALISITATVAGAPAAEVYSQASFATQQIAPGQSLAIPFHFKVPKGTTGALQIAVTDSFNEPMFFTGQLR